MRGYPQAWHLFARFFFGGLERFGKPLAFYSDKASVFRINNASAVKGPGYTQFGRALSLELEIAELLPPPASDCAELDNLRGKLGANKAQYRRPFARHLYLARTPTSVSGSSSVYFSFHIELD